MQSFWTRLQSPFIVAAPMADGTDAPFRRVIAKYGKPGVLFTEFVSCDGLCSSGKDKLLRELSYTEAERPIVAQLFTGRPENMERCAALIQELGFDGLDINMGCPDRSVEKQGAGAALLKKPEIAVELILAAKRGAPKLPISVKTRIGYHTNSIEDWTNVLLSSEPAAISFHLRTRQEMSKVPAHWEEIRIPVQLAKGTGIKIIGNGDVKSREEAIRKAETYGVDGVMVGRALFGNPWFASGRSNLSEEERLHVLLEHAQIFEQYFSDSEYNRTHFHGHKKSFAIMRKHMNAYLKSYSEFHQLRNEILRVENASGVEHLIRDHLKKATP